MKDEKAIYSISLPDGNLSKEACVTLKNILTPIRDESEINGELIIREFKIPIIFKVLLI